MLPTTFRYNPTASGLATALPGTELEIMEIIWGLDKAAVPITCRLVHRRINKARDLAYTTVASTMNRMEDKGLIVARERQSDMVKKVYRPAFSRDEFVVTVVDAVLGSLIETYGAQAVHDAVERRVARCM